MNCPKCNAQNDDAALVCMVCGEPLDSENTAVEDKTSALEELKMKRLKKQKGRLKKKIAIICIIAIIVIGGIVYGIYSIGNGSVDTPDGDNIVMSTITPAATPEMPFFTLSPEPTPSEEATIEPIVIPPVGTESVPVISSPVTTKSPVVSATKKPAATKKTAATKKPTAPVTSKATSAPKATATPKPAQPSVQASKDVDPEYIGTTETYKPSAKPQAPDTLDDSDLQVITDEPVYKHIYPGLPLKSVLVSAVDGGKTADGKKSLVKLSIGSDTYYAYSEGIDFSDGLPAFYYINAAPTSEKHLEEPIYNITSVKTSSSPNYLLPFSNVKPINESDLVGFTKIQLTLARCEIFARHGRIFMEPEIQEYFRSKVWYSADPDYDYADEYKNLSDIEAKNAKFILAQENK